MKDRINLNAIFVAIQASKVIDEAGKSEPISNRPIPKEFLRDEVHLCDFDHDRQCGGRHQNCRHYHHDHGTTWPCCLLQVLHVIDHVRWVGQLQAQQDGRFSNSLQILAQLE